MKLSTYSRSTPEDETEGWWTETHGTSEEFPDFDSPKDPPED